jgi:hypothetical protein
MIAYEIAASTDSGSLGFQTSDSSINTGKRVVASILADFTSFVASIDDAQLAKNVARMN